MKKHVIVLLILSQSITFHVSAMEQTAQPCYFAKLPLEICNYIASFLLWETDEELIVRSKAKRAVVPIDYYKYFEKGLFGCSESELFCVLSPDESKCAVLKLFDFDCAQPNLTIVDLCTKEKTYQGDIKNNVYECLALSCSGTMIATIHKHRREAWVLIGPTYPYVVTLHKVNTQKNRTFAIPHLSEQFTIDFNKQGTDIIVHGTEYGAGKNCKKHIILSLKNSEVNQSINAEEKQNQLHNYFRHNRVCKMLSNS